MRVPLSWLKEYVDIPLPTPELVQRLTLGGLEVEEVQYIGVEGGELPWDPSLILVANILEVRQHPNADRLVVADVDYGAEKPHTVVTGAPNLFQYKGQGRLGHPLKAVFAKEGSRLYDGHAEGKVITTLKGRPVRGVMSDAMLCSEKELGISDEHEGILILEDDAPVGAPLRDYLGDVVLDIAITPNMARCLSIVGVAREVAALTGGALHIPDVVFEPRGPELGDRVKVTVEDPALCPRFTAGLAEGVQIGPSPAWMQRRLAACGMRPISNVVDISNYVMLEWGGPNHMFDADRVHGQHLVVRSANPGEKLTTLDGKEHTLSPDRLLVCDPEGALSLAGVMGGATSEVSESTTRVLVEAAVWEPTTIRRTAQALRLPSEASRRFERGVDIESPPVVQRRLLQLLQDLAGATAYAGIVDENPQPWQPLTLELPPSEVTRLLGITLSAPEIAQQLQPLGFQPQVVGSAGGGAGDFAHFQTEQAVRVRVPSWRRDVSVLADLVEDVARIYDYERIPATQLADTLPNPDEQPEIGLEQRVRDVLVGAGLNEVITYTVTNMETVALLDPAAAEPSRYVRLANPSTPEHEYMRQTVLSTLLPALAQNVRERGRSLLFEIGRGYLPVPGELLPDEPMRLAIAMAGPREVFSWHALQSAPLDFFDLKGVVETLLARLHIAERVEFVPIHDDSRFHPGRAAELVPKERASGTNGPSLGVLGELHPQARERLGLSVPRVGAAELELGRLLQLAQQVKYAPISRFPATVQDLAVVAEIDVPSARIAAVIERASGDLLESLTLFDTYQGPQIGEGKRSLAYRLSFRAPDRTLSDDALAKVRAKIIKALGRELGATIRA
jgi:phenylalanyl-tRNA synthetase beta chain